MIDLIIMEVWKIDGQTYGRVRTDQSPTVLAQQYGTAYDLSGKAAHYFCVTDDRSISRSDCVRFCHDHFRGSTRAFNVDLSQIYIDRADRQHRLKFKG